MKPITMIAAVLVWLGLTGGAVYAQDYTFRLHHFLGAKSPSHTEMLVPWARAVEERSDGAVKIEIFPSMTLGGRPPELVSQARDGVVDLIWTVNGYTPGLFPRTEVMELPTVFVNDPRAANLALYDMFDSDLREDYKGLEVMFLHVHAGQAIQMRDKPVHAPGDLAGLKLRIPTRTGAWVIEALGATPVAMPVPDLPVALQKGVVDGALIPWEIIKSLQLQDQTAYLIEGAEKERLGTTTFQLSMNAARWNALPPEIQQAFRDASDRDWVAKVGDIYRRTENKGIEMAVAAGNTHITLSDEETLAFRDVLAPVVERWIDEVGQKGIDGAALVERARALIAENANGT